MIVNENQSADLELMLTREVGVMKDLLQKSGFQVVVATASKRPLEAGDLKLQPDLELSNVRVSDYRGFIMPCMATSLEQPVSSEVSAIINEAAGKGKPVAAQTGSVVQLWQAGVLKGKKYALGQGLGVPPLADATYSGDGIVQGSVWFYSSFDNGVTWKLIDTIVSGFGPGPNSHDWTPLVTISKTSCKVKVVLKNEAGTNLATDVSDHVFSISLP